MSEQKANEISNQQQMKEFLNEINYTIRNINSQTNIFKNNIQTEIKNNSPYLLMQDQANTELKKLSELTSLDLITNMQYLLDYCYAQNAMVKKAIDLQVESAYEKAPIIKTDLLNPNDLQQLQKVFNAFFQYEFKESQKLNLLYGGVFLLMGVKQKDKQNNEYTFNMNIDDISEGDSIVVTYFTPWQIIDRLAFTSKAIKEDMINNIQDQSIKEFFENYKKSADTVESKNKPKNKNTEQNFVIYDTDNNTQEIEEIKPDRYFFSSQTPVDFVNRNINETLIFPVTNGFAPYNVKNRLINKWCGLSIIETLDRDLRNYEEVVSLVMKLLQVPLIRQIKIPGLDEIFSRQDSERALDDQLGIILKKLKTDGVLITDGDTTTTQLQTAFTGLVDILTYLTNNFIEKSDIPLNIWRGEGASGMNASGDDVNLQWTKRLSIIQSNTKNVLERIVRCQAKTLYGIDLTDLSIEYDFSYNLSLQDRQFKKDGILKALQDLRNLNVIIRDDKLINIINENDILGTQIEKSDLQHPSTMDGQQNNTNYSDLFQIMND